MSYENLVVETQGARTRLVINRPKALNALNRATLTELGHAIDHLPADTRVVVITGAGDKAFVAGADIAEMKGYDAAAGRAFSALGHEVFAKLERLDAVVIAEVNGFALGGGCELMLACDFAIASGNARLGQPEVKLGVTPGFGGSTRLVRRIGRAWANQLLFTGDQLDAERALALGLVNEVVAREALRARVDEIADRITANAPGAVAATKRAARVAAEVDLGTANLYEQEIFGACFATADQKEGMAAFLGKRPAALSGR
jgi:enoyl-CoA hydratase